MTYLVDSDWVIDRLIGKPVAVQFIDALRVDGLAISVVTYGEVYQGVDDGRDPVAAEATFRAFLVGIEVLPIDGATARRFFRVRRDLRAQGTPLDDPDLLVAATALRHDLTLVTRNRRHFDRIRGLKVHP